MNRREIEEMRRRLADRSAAEGEDSPVLLGLAAVLFVVLIIIANFI
jgi:hypothetical protein